MYAEASSPQKEGDVAVLRSAVMYSATPTCMVFFYNRNGKNLGKLSLGFSEPKDGRWNFVEIKNMTESAGPEWVVQRMDLPVDVNFVVGLPCSFSM